ncbi:glycosyl transferase family 17 protein [Musa troglodytarum]|uniref:Glycosyl transferase family 17 protein n=1 Tax=Musa troglodytarum TaxID=320322 RepID=A0A9E7HFD4_9LILI|nr:glycosyl transferase family 17 protein [Musa troglodytarum]
MPETGYPYRSKKTDDICDDVCGEASRAALSMSKRLRCALRWFDLKALLLLLIGVPILIFVIHVHGQKFTYFLRPLWESPPKPFRTMPHYHHENVSMENLCKLHGWGIREIPRRVFDAVLFSNELDILEVRWNELSPYVSEFILLESNSTFTGLKKPLFFASNRRFKFVESRLTYGTGESFVEESYQRVALDQLIRIAGISDDLLIMSDVDEIPSGHTINLLRWCDDIPEMLHLQMRNYLYSFEFYVDDDSWRASIHRYRDGKTRYAHFRQTDDLLADSGWHCSFCFRHISEFIFKMKAYSHVDRVRFSYYLSPSRIQDVICHGADLFDMLPEEYTFQKIIAKLGPIPSSYSAVNLPSYLIQNADRTDTFSRELQAKTADQVPVKSPACAVGKASSERSNWGSPFRPSRSLRLPSSSKYSHGGERKPLHRHMEGVADHPAPSPLLLKRSIATAAAAGNIRTAVESSRCAHYGRLPWLYMHLHHHLMEQCIAGIRPVLAAQAFHQDIQNVPICLTVFLDHLRQQLQGFIDLPRGAVPLYQNCPGLEIRVQSAASISSNTLQASSNLLALQSPYTNWL